MNSTFLHSSAQLVMMNKTFLTIFLVVLFFGTSWGIMAYSKNFLLNQRNRMRQMAHLESQFVREYTKFVRTGKRSSQLKQILKSSVKVHSDVRGYEMDKIPENLLPSVCIGCRLFLATLLNVRRYGMNKQLLGNIAVLLCNELNLSTKEVCRGAVRLNLDPIAYIIDKNPKMEPDAICGLVLQGKCGDLPAGIEFSINIDSNIPDSTPEKSPLAQNKDFKILHFTDIHYDPDYLINGTANCHEPICCKKNKGLSKDPANSAGYWGDYRNCDLPWHSVVNALDQIRKHVQEEKIDVVYFTGDIIDHSIWTTSIKKNLAIMEKVHNLIKEKLKDVALFPIIGNHETHPVNVFAPSNVTRCGLTTQWLYDYLAETYATWLPESALKTVRKGGYYTAEVKKGFRVIGLNNNICYTFNWWSITDHSDLVEQLQWLHDVLLEAEKAHEKVHVLAHIPMNEGFCHKFWTREYIKIIQRFKNVIAAQFNGHTHRMEFQVFYGEAEVDEPINVAWNGGSITTFVDVNPNYMVYHISGNDYDVAEVESWIFNLTEANLNPEKPPNWFKQFSFKETFGLPDLKPVAMDMLLDQMARNHTKLRELWKFKVKGGDPSIRGGCDVNCKKSVLCDIVDDIRKCQSLTDILEYSFV